MPMLSMIRFVLVGLALAAGSLTFAQDPYPSRPIRLVTPNAPGSSIDTLGRILATRLPAELGQSVLIENRAGASGAIGMEMVRAAVPDGHTLAIASASSMSVAPLVQKKAPYDPVNDFTHVTLFAVMPNVLIVHPALPIQNVKQLLDYARANAGKVNMASAGAGAASHLAGVFLQTLAGFDSVHVPYKGGGPSVASVVAGESHWTLTPAPAAMAVARAGRVRAIAQSLDRRSPAFGELAAIAETVPGYDYSGWAGIVGPKGLAPAIVERVRAALAATLAVPAVREALAAQGAEIVAMGPNEFRAYLARDVENTARVVKAARIEPE